LAEVYVHFVWATWDRHPLLTEHVRPRVYNCIRGECARMKAEVVAIGGVEDHVHVLVRVPATISLSMIVKQLKGVSSHMVNHTTEGTTFKWQGGYGAFSVSRRLLPRARDYVLHQEERHRRGNLVRSFEPH
jgi:REP element-mobilizing transposase RayT